MTIKYSFTTMGTPEQDHCGAIEFAKSFGYQGIDLRCSDFKGELEPNSDDDHIATVAADMRAANFVIPSMLCYNKVIKDGGASSWDEVAEDLNRHLEIGAKLGVQSIRTFGGHWGERFTREEYLDGFAETLKSVLSGSAHGIPIVIQNHGGALNAGDSIDLAEKVDRDDFGLVFSPDHTFIQNEGDLMPIFERAYPRIKEVYLSDVKANDEGKYHGIMPGEGVVPLREIRDQLEKRGFEGFATFKWEKLWQNNLEEPEEALPRFMEIMRG